MTLTNKLGMLVAAVVAVALVGGFAVRRRMDAVAADLQALAAPGLETAVDRLATARQIQLWMLAALVGLGLAAVAFMRRTTVERISRLTRAAESAARASESDGDPTPEVPVVGSDELALLTERFNRMVARRRAVEAELVSARERLERDNQALRQLDQMKHEFVASVSHELRTPLTAIVAYTELLLEGEPGPLTDEQREFLQVMDRSSHRLRRMVDDLLLLARMDAGGFDLEPGPVDLAALTAEAVAGAVPQARRDGVELVLDADPPPTFRADRARLSQAVENLIANAVKFTPDGGSVAVRLFCEDDRAVLEVADTGIGIPGDEQDRVFQRFFRTSRSRSTTIGGSGIGLTVVKAVAEAHGGWVSLHSVDGTGATFRMEIPMVGVDGAMVGIDGTGVDR